MSKTEFRVSLRVYWPRSRSAPLDVFDDLFHLLYHHSACVLGSHRGYWVVVFVWAFDAEEALHLGVRLLRASARALGLPSGPVSDLEVEPREVRPYDPADTEEEEDLPESGVVEQCVLCDLLALGDHGDCLICRFN